MRNLLTFVLMFAFVGSVAAENLSNVARDLKTNDHVGTNPGTADGREGGDDMGSAVVIAALPYNDTGNTSDNTNQYDAECPYSGSTSADEVYSFSPAVDVVVTIDLFGSTYDTKTYVMLADGTIVACNDDFYPDYVSKIEEALLVAGTEYFIVIDGYGGDAGDYVLEIAEYTPPPPCNIDCGDDENEPPLIPGYLDAWNGGCNSPDFGNPFQVLYSAHDGHLVFCGQSGWFDSSRDTDWFIVSIGEFGMIEWTVDAEQPTNIYQLGPEDCDSVGVVQNETVNPCVPGTMTIYGTPGEYVWLWVGPSEFSGPVNEYNYLCTFTGLFPVSCATEGISFDGIKSLYR
ncbi:MAG: hypothetical protein GY780_16910 [bacterium]|nr:hypothetical protein [bacterium]